MSGPCWSYVSYRWFPSNGWIFQELPDKFQFVLHWWINLELCLQLQWMGHLGKFRPCIVYIIAHNDITESIPRTSKGSWPLTTFRKVLNSAEFFSSCLFFESKVSSLCLPPRQESDYDYDYVSVGFLLKKWFKVFGWRQYASVVHLVLELESHVLQSNCSLAGCGIA